MQLRSSRLEQNIFDALLRYGSWRTLRYSGDGKFPSNKSNFDVSDPVVIGKFEISGIMDNRATGNSQWDSLWGYRDRLEIIATHPGNTSKGSKGLLNRRLRAYTVDLNGRVGNYSDGVENKVPGCKTMDFSYDPQTDNLEQIQIEYKNLRTEIGDKFNAWLESKEDKGVVCEGSFGQDETALVGYEYNLPGYDWHHVSAGELITGFSGLFFVIMFWSFYDRRRNPQR